jgi:putative transposase
MLRRQLRQHPVDLLGYCLTSNHVHLLLTSGCHAAIGEFMQVLAGDFARAYNRRKGRQNAFWGGRYHATLVDSEKYIWRCLRYIDLNMIRAGVVEHPGEWEWCSYREISGQRSRYRLINRERLLEALNHGSDFQAFQSAYTKDVAREIAKDSSTRQPEWTESLAVGREEFVQRVAGTIKNRKELSIEPAGKGRESWVVRERRPSYA